MLRPFLLFRVDDSKMELVQLLLGDGRGSIHHRVDAAAELREGDHLADIRLVEKEHDQAVDTWRDSGVGGRAVGESLQHVAELRLNLLVGMPKLTQDGSLNL